MAERERSELYVIHLANSARLRETFRQIEAQVTELSARAHTKMVAAALRKYDRREARYGMAFGVLLALSVLTPVTRTESDLTGVLLAAFCLVASLGSVVHWVRMSGDARKHVGRFSFL